VPKPESRTSNPESQIPNPLFACLYQPPAPAAHDDQHRDNVGADRGRPGLLAIASEFSPRYEQHRDDLVTIDISGLGRLLGDARAIGEELRRAASARGLRVHVAIAGTRTAAMVLAHARPGLTVVEPDAEARALAIVPIGILDKIHDQTQSPQSPQKNIDPKTSVSSVVSVLKSWGIRTFGELAALPPADLAARLGRQGLVWQAIARGADGRPLVPTLIEDRFESSVELEWPIEGLEPLSFVLTRLLEPLSTRLERRDRGAAVLHVMLRLAGTGLGTCSSRNPSPPIHARSLQLPTPIRDVRTLRTLALLDLESHPPDAAVDRVTIRIDPTPGRVLQHALFTRAHPTPEQLSTLLARLGALMGQDRLGAPALVDSYRPGAFEMRAFATNHESNRRARGEREENVLQNSANSARSAVACAQVLPATSPQPLATALRRCRQPVPARVAVEHGAPVRVTTDRRGFAGGTVVACAGPWRTSGDWWASKAGKAGEAGKAGKAGEAGKAGKAGTKTLPLRAWHRDEWDVALSDGAVYRIFQDRDTEGWFVDAIVD
jgi:protein ImuB